MTKRKSTKRALLLSALSLLMCVSMLIGSTFAWFTDSVTSAGNTIISGTLDVDLIGADDNSVAGRTLEFLDKDGKVLSDILWEPGCTYTLEPVRVKNNGNLWLKYEIVISGIEGNAKLLEAIEWTVDGAPLKGSLEPKTATEALKITGHMKEEAGNEYQDLTLDGISITVYATQVTAEFDSFDNQYDKDAFYYDVLATSADELYAAVASASGETVIAIDGNIVLNKALSKAGLESITFVAFDEDATIDQATYNMYFSGAKVTFKNLTLTHGEKAYGDGGQTSTAFAVWHAKEVNYIDCTFNRSVGTIHAPLHNFIGCTFNGVENPGNTKSEYPLYICDGQDYNVIDCVFNCTNRGAILFYNDGGSGTDTLNITNTKFLGSIIDDKTAVEIHNNSKAQVYNVNIKNATVGNKIEKGLYRIKPANIGEVNVNVDGVTEVATVSDAAELNAAYDNAQPGDTVYLDADVTYTGNGYANLTKDVTIDLNGNTLSTTSNGVIATAGTIKNGVVSNPVGVRAALRTWSGVSIEDVIVEAPENGGITVASGNSLPSIKNVTIKAKTYGIELQYGASVGTIENVTIDAEGNGIVVQAGTIGNISNSVIKGANAGIWGQLKGVYDLKISVGSTNEISGGKYGIYLCDEGATIVPDGIAYLTYDENTTFEGGVKDMEFAFGQTGKLVINGAKADLVISTADELFDFAKKVNEEGKSFSGLTVLLNSDIDLENKVWTPIGQTGATEFKGIFDGQGHTIKNLNVDSAAQTGEHYSSGLFGWIESSNHITIKNVKIDGATVVGHHNVAVIAGYTEGNAIIDNCYVSNATLTNTHANADACGDKTGLIAGYAGAEVIIKNCSGSDSTINSGRDAGQLVGAGHNKSVSNCTATNVTVAATDDCNREGNLNNTIIGRVLG